MEVAPGENDILILATAVIDCMAHGYSTNRVEDGSVLHNFIWRKD